MAGNWERLHGEPIRIEDVEDAVTEQEQLDRLSCMHMPGIVILMRHGDRTSFYQNPKTYAASQTNLTVLGQNQLLKNGKDLRSTYIVNGASKLIPGISADLAQDAQIAVEADGAGEGEVIIDSAYAMLQGLYPAAEHQQTLANGQVVSWNGTQAIRVNTIEDGQDFALEGFTSCDTFSNRLTSWYNSKEFKQQAAIANPFFQSLKSILGNRPLALENAWNLYDYLNVESIHNSTISNQVTAEQLENARFWANYHESGSFSDPDPENVGNVAGQSFVPTLLSNIARVANATDPLKISYTAFSYKPFLSLFSMWNVSEPTRSSIVDYGSTLVLEVHTDNTFNVMFRNGTEDAFAPLTIMGQDANIPISEFSSKMQPLGLETLADWCNACQTDDANGCSVLAQYNGTGGAGFASVTSTNGHHQVSPVVAGVIGAMVTLAVVAVLLALGLLAKKLFGGRKSNNAAAAQAVQHTGSDRASSNGTHAGSMYENEKGVETRA